MCVMQGAQICGKLCNVCRGNVRFACGDESAREKLIDGEDDSGGGLHALGKPCPHLMCITDACIVVHDVARREDNFTTNDLPTVYDKIGAGRA